MTSFSFLPLLVVPLLGPADQQPAANPEPTKAQPPTSTRPSEKGPVFLDYGPVYEIKDIQVPPRKGLRYKILFDISKAAKSKTSYNRRIENVARFYNMQVRHGVPLKNIRAAVILHGTATRDGLSHAAYNERYGADNPSLELIQVLRQQGVRFYQCGQSAYHYGHSAKDFSDEVGVALSALTMLTDLQSQGYRLIPW